MNKNVCLYTKSKNIDVKNISKTKLLNIATLTVDGTPKVNGTSNRLGTRPYQ